MRHYWTEERYQITYSKRVTHASPGKTGSRIMDKGSVTNKSNKLNKLIGMIDCSSKLISKLSRVSVCDCASDYCFSSSSTQWGNTILSLSESCPLSNPVGKTTKTSSSKQVILQMHSIWNMRNKDMRSVKI